MRHSKPRRIPPNRRGHLRHGHIHTAQPPDFCHLLCPALHSEVPSQNSFELPPKHRKIYSDSRRLRIFSQCADSLDSHTHCPLQSLRICKVWSSFHCLAVNCWINNLPRSSFWILHCTKVRAKFPFMGFDFAFHWSGFANHDRIELFMDYEFTPEESKRTYQARDDTIPSRTSDGVFGSYFQN